MKEIISVENAPQAIGPYSQAVKADGFIFVSGQLGVNPETGKFVGESIKQQTAQCIENAIAILASKGYTLDDVIKTTVYLDNINEFTPMNTVYSEYFKNDCPARAAFAVQDLPLKAKVEIEMIAYK